MTLKTIWENIVRWQYRMRQSRTIRALLAFFQYGLLAGVILYLVWRFAQMGWANVIDALPLSPWFYFFFSLRFLALPISEMLIFEMIWKIPLRQHFAAFLRKRVYNFSVMSYSGEGFLTLWARRALPLSERDVIVGVKDNNLLSALASNIATVGMILWLFFSGRLAMGVAHLPPGGGWLFVVAFCLALTLSVSVIVFRKKIISLRSPVLTQVMAIHAGRMIMILILHAGMYAAALPGTAFTVWMVFITLQLVLSRIPFIPNQDLVFMGAALSLASLANVTDADIAAMLLAEAGLSQLLNLVLFFATAYLAKGR